MEKLNEYHYMSNYNTIKKNKFNIELGIIYHYLGKSKKSLYYLKKKDDKLSYSWLNYLYNTKIQSAIYAFRSEYYYNKFRYNVDKRLIAMVLLKND